MSTASAVVPVGYKQTEASVIPEDWDVKTIGELLQFKNGLNKGKEFFGHGTAIINYMDVFSHSGLSVDDIAGKVTVTSQEQLNYSTRRGDVFFTRTSETVDEIGISAVLLDDLPEGVFSGFVLRGRPISKYIIPEFSKYCFGTYSVRKQIISTASYTTRALTNGRLLSRANVIIPRSKEEQKRISSSITDIENLTIHYENLIMKKQAIKQGAMQELLTGKIRLPGFNEDWIHVKLNNLAITGSGGTPDTKNPQYYGGMIPWASITDMTQSGKNISKTERNLTQKGFDNSAAQLFPKGTILYAMYASIGECCIANVELTTSQAILGIQTKQRLNQEYLYYHLMSIKEDVLNLGQQGTQSNLNSQIVGQFMIPLPEINEQEAIAEVLSDMDAEITALEKPLEKAKAIKQGMMQQLLTGKIRLVD